MFLHSFKMEGGGVGAGVGLWGADLSSEVERKSQRGGGVEWRGVGEGGFRWGSTNSQSAVRREEIRCFK